LAAGNFDFMGQAKRRGTYEERVAQAKAKDGAASVTKQTTMLTPPLRRIVRRNTHAQMMVAAALVGVSPFNGK
jgi:hypothetical protein